MANFDYAATKPEIADEVIEKIISVLKTNNGNPSAVYKIGRTAKELLENARKNVSDVLGCKPEEIIFTSGGSEADNMAIKGVVFASLAEKKHIITTKMEHKAVLETCKFLEVHGLAEVTYLEPGVTQYITPCQLEEAIRDDTILISIMSVNNEIGTTNPIHRLSEVAHKHGILFHTDAVQFSRVGVPRVWELGVDLMSISGHKFGAPKGVGVLYIKDGVAIEPLIHGGGQEFGLRAGTENLAYIVALGEAIKTLPKYDFEKQFTQSMHLRTMLRDAFKDDIKFVSENSDISGILNFAIKDIPALELQAFLDMNNIYMSIGSACSSGDPKASHVLEAFKIPESEIHNYMRVSISAETTDDEIDEFVALLKFYVSMK